MERHPAGTSAETASVRAWALVTGYVGVASALALVLFFGLSDPFGQNLRTWSWLGPANDVLLIVMVPAQAVAMVLVWRAIRPAPIVAGLTWLTIAALVAAATVTARMLAGAATLDTQFMFAVPQIVLMFWWLLAVGLRALRRRRDAAPDAARDAAPDALTRGLARWAVITGGAGLAALLLFALAYVFPAESAGRLAFFVIGGVPGAVAYLGFPVWWLMLGVRRS
ncbi:hypothetical protein [Agromyces italicus]|uniref:hypothetical protein n=1 Tax=Agromyces italicus TaxID=279572 RepID=UPI0003B37EC1|nr:hypothetical protein [Agromyces italicus]